MCLFQTQVALRKLGVMRGTREEASRLREGVEGAMVVAVVVVVVTGMLRAELGVREGGCGISGSAAAAAREETAGD